MAETSLIDTLNHYHQELERLQKAESDALPPSKQRALDVLLARDAIQATLDEETAIPAHLLLDLEAGDRTLKQHKNLITQHHELNTWRTMVNPPADSWWWFLDPPARFSWLEQKSTWLDRLDWLWMGVSLFALTLSFTIILDTLNRVVGEGLDTSGMFPVILQVVLTLAGGAAALTDRGRNLLETAMTRLRIPRHYWQELSMVVSLVVLALVFTIHESYLPYMAQERQQDGIAAHEAGEFDSAMQAYQQAIALRPDFTAAHYYLGSLYEDLQKEEEAIAQYQIVTESDPNSLDKLIWVRAHNNLGRLYLLRDDNRTAWIPLDRGLSEVDATLVESDPDLQYEYYNLLKNMAWLRLNQERYLEADPLLREAIQLDNERAPAHCLQAQVLDAQEQLDTGLESWEKCVQYADGNNPDEDHWIGMAYQAFEREENTP